MQSLAVVLVTAMAAGAFGANVPEYPNTRPGVAFTGSKSCAAAKCHEAICRTFPSRPMGETMRPANSAGDLARAPQPVTVYREDLKRYFQVYREGADLFESEYEMDAEGKTVYKDTRRLEYSVGGGINGYTYIVRRGGHLFEAPLSFYSNTKTWDLSPGYSGAPEMGFNRPILTGCLACHNGQPVGVPERDGMYREPPFRFGEMTVSCEVCHGPGELHIKELEQHGAAGAGQTIVNPARLPARLADDVCMYCHQGGNTRVLQPGKQELDFRPGLPLYETAAFFRVPISKEQREAADLAEKLPPVRGGLSQPAWWKNSSMEMSKCFRASGGQLRCVTCHKIHERPTPATRAEYFRKACLTCHADTSCAIPRVKRAGLKPANDCAGCHMPRRPVGGIAHTSLTNHRVVRAPGQPLPNWAFDVADPDLPGLYCLNRPAGRPIPELTKLVAYGETAKQKPELHQQYLRVLDGLSRSDPENALVLASLGRKALYESQPAAVDYLSRALQQGSRVPDTYLDLGEALARAGRVDEAASVLEKGVDVWPYVPALQKSLTLRYITLKRYDRALQAMKHYLELFPGDSFMRGLLEKAQSSGSH